jgi:hypothetical protein
LIHNDIPALRRDRLSWVNQNYIREETLLAANAKLVSAQNQIALAHAWGGREVASADGIRFVVPVATVHARPNPKYFGIGRGVTYLQPQLQPVYRPQRHHRAGHLARQHGLARASPRATDRIAAHPDHDRYRCLIATSSLGCSDFSVIDSVHGWPISAAHASGELIRRPITANSTLSHGSGST